MRRFPGTTLSNALIILTVIAAAINFASDWLPSSSGQIWVSAESGSDWHSGASQSAALRTIQAAADRARPGDTIVVLPGTYVESVHLRRGGMRGKPLVLKAHEPGTVTLSNVAPPGTLAGLDWQDEGDGIFSALPPWPIYAVRVGEAATYHLRWGGIDLLRELGSREGAWPMSYFDGESGLLYLFLPAGRLPQNEELLTHREIPPPREWYAVKNANLWIEAGDVVVEGLKFDFAVGAAIRLWNAPSATIRDCMFTGAAAAVAGRPRIGEAGGLVLENNFYSNYPQYHWRKDFLAWDELYRHYSEYSLASSLPSGARVAGNLVANFGDGIGVTTDSAPTAAAISIEENLLYRGTDDAFEIEGAAVNVKLSRNLVFDAHESLGLSPVLSGPVLVEHNLFLHPSDGINGSQIKLLASAPADDVPPPTIRNITIANNEFVGNWLAWWRDTPMENIAITGNVFHIVHSKEPPFPPDVKAVDNTLHRLGSDDYLIPELELPFALPSTGPDWFQWATHDATRDLMRELPGEILVK